jgi:hypothetical protein
LRQRNRQAVANPAVRQVAAPCKTKVRPEARREVRAGNPPRIAKPRSAASPRAERTIRRSRARGERGQKDQTTGQAPQREQGAQGKDMEEGQKDKGQQTQRDQRGKDQTTGQGQREQGQGSSQTPNQTQRDQGQMPQRQQGQQGQSQQDGQAQPGGQAQQGQSGGNAQGGGNVTLSTEQRTKIRETVLVGGNVPRVSNVNFSISVGTTVPTSVHVVEVSPVLIEIHPEWRGHLYFVVNDEIIIVDRNHRIIAVITV